MQQVRSVDPTSERERAVIAVEKHLTAEAETALARLHKVRSGMTACTVDRLIKVARTIADLADEDTVSAHCLLEAAAYRALDGDPGTALGRAPRQPRGVATP